MKIRFGETIIEANDAWGLIVEMHKRASFAAGTVEEYMKDVAYRAEVQSGKDVRTHPPAAFIQDLIGAGLIEEVKS